MEATYLWLLVFLLFGVEVPISECFPKRAFVEVDSLVGKPLWLNCSASGQTGPAKWTFQNQELNSNENKVFSNGTLFVPRADLAHAGVFQCQRKNSTIVYLVAIKAKPRVTVDVMPAANVSRGMQVEIICKGVGSLPLRWSWFKDDVELRLNGRPVEADMNRVKVRLNRTARISCEARNDYGRHRSNLTVFVFNGLPPVKKTTTKPPTTTTPPKPIECLFYLGSVCKHLLPTNHKWAFGGPSQAAFDLQWREAATQELFRAAEASGSFQGSNATCGHGVKAMLCGLVFPTCTSGRSGTSGRSWQRGRLCREHCQAVDRLFCPSGLASQLLNAVQSQLGDRPELQALLLPTTASLCVGLPQGMRLQAQGSVQADTAAPLCTAVRLEQESDQATAIDVCYEGRGAHYRGTVDRFRASRKGKLQPCAKWNSQHARAVLDSEGYSVAAFPSLANSGKACRNPAGLKPWPVCVPENPTMKRLVRCDIVSCELILTPPPGSHYIQLWGLKLTRSKFAVSLSVLVFVSLALLVFLLYCGFCRHHLGRHHSRLNAKSRHKNDSIALKNTPSPPSVNQSEYDVSDPKSALLTPNQDYHGKALSEYINPRLQRMECPRDDIVDIKELGRGAFGEVFLVEAKKPGETEGESCRMAMKILKNDATYEMEVQFLREASLLADLEHDNIVKLMGVSLVYKPYCMLMEYMCHGDLNSYLRRHDPNSTAMRVDIDQAAVAMHARANGHVGGGGAGVSSQPTRDELNRYVLCNMAIEIAEGMIYLSYQNFIHRDLATRNCLLDINKHVKIADFGLCRHIKRGEDFIDDDHGAMPVRWMPLEAILERRFNLDTDVWSFGVLLWELFSYALQPYFGKGHEEVIAYLQKGSVLDKPPDAPDGVYVLMLRCWSRQRRERPSFAFLKRQLCELTRRWKPPDEAEVT